MPGPLASLDNGSDSGTPLNPHLANSQHCALDAPEQARRVFLAGCGLPAAWGGQSQWRILETNFGLGLNFLLTWAAWRADPLRPKLLHFVATEDHFVQVENVPHSATEYADLQPLALQLRAQLWGLLPGFHRLVFEDGHVLLTLCIGEFKAVLQQQQFEADSVYLNGFSPAKNFTMWDVHTLKAVARCCRRGTRIATSALTNKLREGLSQCGFVVDTAQDTDVNRDTFQGQYNPSWEPKKPLYLQRLPGSLLPRQPSTAVVVGAGLAGAAIANSLARRGWQVVVLDAANTPASGASGLPAGLLVPHVSTDDSLLSRLSRSGVRMTLQQADALLKQGADWGYSGVLEHAIETGGRALPEPASEMAADWRRSATPAQLADAGLAATDKALWHARAGWIKPASLVNAWLDTPGITWRGAARAAVLQPGKPGWQVIDAAGALLAQADLVVLACAYDSQALAVTVNPAQLKLQPVRGQISWGLHKDQPQGLPDFPVNGHGGLVPAVPSAEGLSWLMGASYERDCAMPLIRPQDHRENLERLQRLLPHAADLLSDAFSTGKVRGWAGIRCATPGRLPVHGCIALTGSGAEVWVCTGMGSRGLTFATLCAELLAARLHGEPWPVERRLAQTLMADIPVAAHP